MSLIITISATVTLVGLSMTMMSRSFPFGDTLKSVLRKKSKKEITDSDEKWTMVGKVKKICIRPLMYGKEYNLRECQVAENAIEEMSDDLSRLRDKMFVIYEENSECVQTTTNFAQLIMINIKAEKKGKQVTFEFPNLPPLILDISTKSLSNLKSCTCKAFCHTNETLYFMKCKDFGSKASKWVSEALTSKDFGYRLAYNNYKSIKNIHLWDSFSPLYEIKRHVKEQKGSKKLTQVTMSQLPYCILLSNTTMSNFNLMVYNKVTSQSLYANIIVELEVLYKECEYENFKFSREEGPMLKNLQPWKGPDIQKVVMPSELRKNLLPIHCELTRTGILKVDDTLYGIEYPKSSTKHSIGTSTGHSTGPSTEFSVRSSIECSTESTKLTSLNSIQADDSIYTTDLLGISNPLRIVDSPQPGPSGMQSMQQTIRYDDDDNDDDSSTYSETCKLLKE